MMPTIRLPARTSENFSTRNGLISSNRPRSIRCHRSPKRGQDVLFCRFEPPLTPTKIEKLQLFLSLRQSLYIAAWIRLKRSPTTPALQSNRKARAQCGDRPCARLQGAHTLARTSCSLHGQVGPPACPYPTTSLQRAPLRGPGIVQNEAAVDQQGRTSAEMRLLRILVNKGKVWRRGTRGPSRVLRGRGRGRRQGAHLDHRAADDRSR